MPRFADESYEKTERLHGQFDTSCDLYTRQLIAEKKQYPRRVLVNCHNWKNTRETEFQQRNCSVVFLFFFFFVER